MRRVAIALSLLGACRAARRRACSRRVDQRVASACAAACSGTPRPQPRPPRSSVPLGFQDSVAFSGLTNPTAVRFAADGRVFVIEKRGLLKVFDSLADTTPAVVADLRSEVDDYWDRGLLGIALDPSFATNGYVYLLYTYDAPPGQTAPVWNDGCPTPPGPNTDGCVVSGRARADPGRCRRSRGRNAAGPDRRPVVPAIPEPLDRRPRLRPRRQAVRQRWRGRELHRRRLRAERRHARRHRRPRRIPAATRRPASAGRRRRRARKAARFAPRALAARLAPRC